MSIFSLKNKNIIVTGASQGNGLAIARGLIRQEANVIGIDKNKPENSDFPIHSLNLNEKNDTSTLINSLIKEHGTINGLINNAGITIATEDPYTDLDDYTSTMNTNLNAVFHLTSILCKHMSIAQTGSIINITSLGSEQGFPKNPSYQISKAGLKQLTKAFACDWGGQGIRLNNICPGYINTSMTQASFKDPILNKQRRSRTMLDRWGEPEDLVGAAVFLLSDSSSYITGSTIYVDGGWTAKGF